VQQQLTPTASASGDPTKQADYNGGVLAHE
jgi:hypothetical protein